MKVGMEMQKIEKNVKKMQKSERSTTAQTCI